MGVSNLSDRFSDAGTDAQCFAAMSEHFERQLASFAPARGPNRRELTRKLQIIGVSGTSTTFGAMHLGLRNYDRSRVDGLWLPTDAANQIAADLLTPSPASPSHSGVVGSRNKLILSGAAILTTVLRLWPVARFRVADRGLREGMLYGLLHQRRIAAQ